MKRFLLSGLLLLGVGTLSWGQGGNYTDDIYFSSEDAKRQAEAEKKAVAQRQQQYDDERDYEYRDYSNDNYSGDEEYIDYDDDDYQYATRIRRFNYPFHNMGYYSPFYDPFWYNPYWVDPYWGWSPWNRPGWSITVGVGGPYWTSFGGWYSWYGYPGFYSAWNYPVYAGGWGYGGWYGGGYGYYNGFWNGYYAGAYSNNAYVRNTTYGPRQSLNTVHNGALRSNRSYNLRDNTGNTQMTNSGLRSSEPRSEYNRVRPSTGTRNNNVRTPDGNATERRNIYRTPDRYNNVNDNNDVREARPSTSQPDRQEPSNRFYRAPSNDAPRQMENRPAQQQPVREQRVQPQQPVRQQPSYQRSAPSHQPSRSYQRSAPIRSAPSMSAPSRSSGGSMRSGGGGGFRRR